MQPPPAPQQQEMPLAVVHGQPLLQIPQDLYIPPDALEVILDAFEGPLDLLLYLIRRQNLDILDIPVAEITRQYVDYINVMQDLRFELAAEYLVMAAILAEIKSRMLLPRPVSEDGDEADPRAELVRRLQEYERFKQAAEDIDALPRQDRDTTPAQAFVPDRAVVKLPPPVDLREMLLALHDVLKRAELFSGHHIKREALSVRQRMGDVLQRLDDGRFHRFEALFSPEEGKLGVLVTFLALLELAKARAGKMNYVMRRADVGAMLSRLALIYGPTAKKIGAEIRCDVPPQLFFTADEEKIDRALTNLLSNALKFVPQPGGRITLAAAPDESGVRFTVQDNGPGIAPEDQEKLFQKFVRLNVKDQAAKKITGNGIGLSITKEIVEGHGGRIWIESLPGHGTRFLFKIPDAVTGK